MNLRRGRNRWRRFHRWRSRLNRRLLLADDGLEHIAGFGDVRQVDLGFDAFGFGAAWAGSGFRRTVTVAAAFKMRADFLSLVFFKRAGVRLLFRDADFIQDIEDCFAFDFQLSSQIVNPNLTHPPLVSSAPSAKSSWQLHG